VQFLVEKLTELGVQRFVPLSCARSVIQPGEGKLDKLRRYVIEASKQCGRNVLMEIADLEAWTEYCRSGKPGEVRLMAHPHTDRKAARDLNAAAPTSIRLAVGPEGGFMDEEVRAATNAGWQLVGLGPRMLRIETAAIALATLTAFGALA